MCKLTADLKLFFGLIFNAVVLGCCMDEGLPAVYSAVFVELLALQYLVRRPVACAYLAQQRTSNRMTAHTYMGQHYPWQPLQQPAVARRLQAAVVGYVAGTSPGDSGPRGCCHHQRHFCANGGF